jgi:hypothetical protein
VESYPLFTPNRGNNIMARIRVKVRQLQERHNFIEFSGRIGMITQTLKRAGKNGRRARVVAGYFGFPDQDSAMVFVRNIQGRFPKARVQVRAAKRLATVVEVKVAGEFVEALVWELLGRTETTGQAISRHLKAVAGRPSLEADVPSLRMRASLLPDVAAIPRHTGRTTVACGGRLIGID